MKFFSSFRGALFAVSGFALFGLWLTMTTLARQGLFQALRSNETNKGLVWMQTPERAIKPLVLEGRFKEAQRLAEALTRQMPHYKLVELKFLSSPTPFSGKTRPMIERQPHQTLITVPLIYQVQVREHGQVSQEGGTLTFTESVRFEDRLHGHWTLSINNEAFALGLRTSENRLVLVGIVSLGVFVVLLFFLGIRLTRPVEELVALGKRVEEGDLTKEAKVLGPGELKDAIQAANSMMLAVRKREHEREEQLVALRELQEETRRLAQLQAHFTAAVSHELKTPLVGIEGFSRLLTLKLEGQEKEDANKVLASALHLKSLINTLLDTVRLSQGDLALHPKPTDLRQVLEEFHRLIAYSLERSSSTLDITTHLPTERVLLDSDRLIQIILNLVGNALKHAEGKPVSLELRHQEDQLLILVKDMGKGIPPQDRDIIFEPFVQLGDAGSKPEGTGLGLFIVRSLARKMGGDVMVKDSEAIDGEGAFFEVRVAAPILTEPGGGF